MSLSSILGLTASTMIAVSIVMLLLRMRRRPPVVRVIVAVAMAALMLVPVDGLLLAGYVRGLIGDPSLATLVLVGCACLTELTDRECFDRRGEAAVMGYVLAAGLLVYPLALGLTTYDTYALGYGSRVLWAALLIVAMVAWAMKFAAVAIIIVLGVAAYLVGLYESRNLWDYLIDPIAVLIAIFWTLRLLGGRLLALFRRKSPSAHRTRPGTAV
jgi:hypothetical protein